MLKGAQQPGLQALALIVTSGAPAPNADVLRGTRRTMLTTFLEGKADSIALASLSML